MSTSALAAASHAANPLERNIAMSKVVAMMSMSLDGYVADRNVCANVSRLVASLGNRVRSVRSP